MRTPEEIRSEIKDLNEELKKASAEEAADAE